MLFWVSCLAALGFLAGPKALLLHQGSSGFVSCSFLLTRLENEEQFSYLGINKDDSGVSAVMESNIEGLRH